MATNLKDYREKELKWYIVANIFLLLALTDCFNFSSNKENLSMIEIIMKLLDSALISGSICVFAFIFDCLWGDSLKDHLLTGLNDFKLHGSTIFSKIKNKEIKDSRFSTQQVLEKYPEIYRLLENGQNLDPEFENVKWYSIYTKYREKTIILTSHRDYLLCRDIFYTNITIIVLYIISTRVRLLPFRKEFIIFSSIMMFISYVAASFKAKRFVVNVIALDINAE